MYYLIAVPRDIYKPEEARRLVDISLGQGHIDLDPHVKPNARSSDWRELFHRLKGDRKNVGFIISDPRYVRSAADVEFALLQEFHHAASIEDHRALDQGYQLTILKTRNLRLRIGDQFTINDYAPRPGLFEIGREEE